MVVSVKSAAMACSCFRLTLAPGLVIVASPSATFCHQMALGPSKQGRCDAV
jgi:hypothetical protein